MTGVQTCALPISYSISVSVSVATWTSATQYLQIKLSGARVAGSPRDRYSSTAVANGGNIIATINYTSELAAGDVLYIEAYQNSGTDKLIQETNTFVTIAKLN